MANYALIVRNEALGVNLVQELFEDKPELHPSLKVADVSQSPGVEPGWEAKANGTFAPYVPPIAAARREQVDILRRHCEAEILAGFNSAALGSVHGYGSSRTDQANLTHDAIAGLHADAAWVAPIFCADASGKAGMVDHTAEQAAKVLSDFQAMRAAAQAKLAKLSAQIQTAVTVDIVRAIVW